MAWNSPSCSPPTSRTSSSSPAARRNWTNWPTNYGRRTASKSTFSPKNLADPAAPQAIFDELAANGVQVDVLVNNAGFGASGPFADLPLQRQLEMIQVNVTALTELTRLFLPAMIERKRGGILNVGSTASFQPGPMMAVYCATKAFVLSFTEALAEEVVGTCITVTCLAPGATETGFAATAGMSKSFLFRSGVMDVEESGESRLSRFSSRESAGRARAEE